MKNLKWKSYQNAYTPKTYYTSVGSLSDYKFLQVKVIEQSIAGTNQKNTHHSKKVYCIVLTDGYKDLKIKFHSLGLVASKKLALEMLENAGGFIISEQMKQLIDTELLKQMKHDIDRGAIQYSDLTTDLPLNEFYCNTNLRGSVYKELAKIYYKYEDYIHNQLELYIESKLKRA